MGMEPCPVCDRPTLDERGAYDICGSCGWEDDGVEQPWQPSGPNAGETLWSARLRIHRPELRGKAREWELERLRKETTAREVPPYLASLGRALGTVVGAADVTHDLDEADRLSLSVHNGPAADVDLDGLSPDAVDAALARAHPAPPALLLDLQYETLFGAVRVDPRVVLARWRAYVRDQSRFLVLGAPDLAGSLTLMPNGDAWHLTIAGAWA